MVRRKGDAIEEIGFGDGIVTAVGNRYSRCFAEFAGKGNASSVQNLCGNRRGSCHHIVLLISPLMRRLGFLNHLSRLQLFSVGLDIRAKDFIGRHPNRQDNTEVAVIGKGKVFAYFNTYRASHLSRLVTTTGSDKPNLPLLM